MSNLIEQIKRHEGFSGQPYLDIEGYTTIGYGFNIDAGITRALGEVILKHQVEEIQKRVKDKYSWYTHLSSARKDVIVNMIFNLGFVGFSQFKRMIAAIESKDNIAVVNEMLDSKWAHQVKIRAWQLADQWRDDCYSP